MSVRYSIIFLFFLFAQNVFAWKVKRVPNPKSIDNTYVSDPNIILKEKTKILLNTICSQMNTDNDVQVAIVLLNSIDEGTPKTFATDLFNSWGIGKENSNSGLLILMVQDERRIEFETGYGLEVLLPDETCYRVQQEYMVPSFRKGDVDAGFIVGLEAIQRIVQGNGEKPPSHSIKEFLDARELSIDHNSLNKTNSKMPFERMLTIAYLILSFFYVVFFALYHLWLKLAVKDPYIKYGKAKFFNSNYWYVFTIIALFIKQINESLMETWRNVTRFSEEDGKAMFRLGEEQDDKYLDDGQRIEEAVKSIDYDVWVTDDHSSVLILEYKYKNSKYRSCKVCDFITYSQDYDKIIKNASYRRKGKGEKKYSCKNCGDILILDYTIPKLVRAHTDSTWNGGGGSWGGGSWSSGSSGGWSSGGGGGSWGGGSSGGGGAGSSW